MTMKLTRPASVMRGILLAIVFGPVLVTSIVTSYEKLRMLVERGDDALIQGIEETITKGQEKMKKLKAILSQYYSIPKTDYQFQADHPNDFYLLVKHHVTAWFDSEIDEDYFPVLQEIIKEQNVTFPTLNDFSDAALALIRLQYVYKLKARDMFEGNYMGYMGPRLEKKDAYLIGKQAFAAGHLLEAKEWLQFSVELMAQDMETFDSESPDNERMTLKFLREDYFLSLSLLGRTLVYLNKSKTARKIYEECKASEVPSSEDVEKLGKELDANLTKLLEDYPPRAKMDYKIITILCSREKHQRVSVIRPHHVCRYKSDRFLPYRRFAEEILSTSPYASVFYDVIHESEIEKIKSIAMEKLQRGRIVGDGSGKVSDTRTGDLGWVEDHEDLLVAQVSARVKAFTGLDVKYREDERHSSEPMQVVNYGLGGHYSIHMDVLSRKEEGIQNRLATVLFYLTDVEKGGATIFPKIGMSVSPVKGMALMWYNYEPHMKDMDLLTHHAGCPVLIGNKWIANKWIWTYGNTFRRPCGPSPQSTQLEVENIASFGALKEVIE